MELRGERRLLVGSSVAWSLLGDRFGQIGEWAAPITASSLDGEAAAGATRTCHIARFGPIAPGAIKERLTTFDRERMTLSYEGVSGLPSFIAVASNRWSVETIDADSCVVRTHATLVLRGPIVMLGPLLRMQMQRDGARVLEDLAHYLERGQPHPRKAARQNGATG